MISVVGGCDIGDSDINLLNTSQTDSDVIAVFITMALFRCSPTEQRTINDRVSASTKVSLAYW